MFKWKSLVDCLIDLAPVKKEGGGTSKASRSEIVKNEIYLLNNPPYDLSDDPSWVIEQEVKFLGCPISMSKIEASDVSGANTTCKEIMEGKNGKSLLVAGNIKRVSNYRIKKGKSKGEYMSFLTIEDGTCIFSMFSSAVAMSALLSVKGALGRRPLQCDTSDERQYYYN